MKNFTKTLLLTSSLFLSAQADFLMTLTDKNGVEENICVKSYSFSNTLESMHKQENQTKDVYSTQETLTNKTWLGKPVYRKVVLLDNFQVAYLDDLRKIVPTPNNMDNIVSFSYNGYLNDALISNNNNKYFIGSDTQTMSIIVQGEYDRSTKTISIYFRNKHSATTTWNIKDLFITIEYTKPIIETIETKNSLITYVHYIPSNSTNNNLLSTSLKNTGIRFLENYTYDSTTDSCIAPTN